MKFNPILLLGGAAAVYLWQTGALRGLLGGTVGTPNRNVNAVKLGVRPASQSGGRMGALGVAQGPSGGMYVAFPGETLTIHLWGKYSGAAQKVRFTGVFSDKSADVASDSAMQAFFAAHENANSAWFHTWDKDVPGSAMPADLATVSGTFAAGTVSADMTLHLMVRVQLLTEGVTLYFGATNVLKVVRGNLTDVRLQ